MKYIIPSYTTNYNLCPFKTEEEASEYGLTFDLNNENSYVVYWGLQPYRPNFGTKYGVMETGFFNEAAFIDTIGNYQTSSLNTKKAYDEIANFDLKGRKTAKEIIFKLPANRQSKFNPSYKENKEKINWKGIVLALQNPSDRSILSVTSTNMYYNFVEECCKFYGNNLFLKMHPWNSGETYNRLASIAQKYNCNYGKTDMGIIEQCEFVIAYNSTFAIDCLLRGVPYVQFGLGTFYNTFGVHFSNYTLPVNITKITNAEKLCDFLIYKYCFNKKMSKENFSKMIKHYAHSNEIFPMVDEFCYANNL